MKEIKAQKKDDQKSYLQVHNEAGTDFRFESKNNKDYHSLFSLVNPLSFIGEAQGRLILTFECEYEGPSKDWPCLFIVKSAIDGSVHKEKWFIGKEERKITLDLSCIHSKDDELTLYFDKNLTGIISLKRMAFVKGNVKVNVRGDVSCVNYEKSWKQQGNKLIVSWFFGSYSMDVPPGFNIEDVHSSTIEIVNYYLFAKVEEFLCQKKTDFKQLFKTPPTLHEGQNIGLSFSMGEDSTAARSILPSDTISIYCRRPYGEYFTANGSLIKLKEYSAVERNMKEVPNVLTIDNTLEMIGIGAGMKFGFRNNFGYASICLMLSNYLKLKTLCYGSVMEQVFLKDGTTYADVTSMPSSLFNTNKRLHKISGVDLALPTGATSEVITSRICKHGPFKELAISCPNADEKGKSCGVCFKCFRKSRLLEPELAIAPTDDVKNILGIRPLKSATSVLFACDNSGELEALFPDLCHVNIAFLSRYYAYGLNKLVPSYLLEGIKVNLEKLEIESMSNSEEYELSQITKYLNPKVYEG